MRQTTSGGASTSTLRRAVSRVIWVVRVGSVAPSTERQHERIQKMGGWRRGRVWRLTDEIELVGRRDVLRRTGLRADDRPVASGLLTIGFWLSRDV